MSDTPRTDAFSARAQQWERSEERECPTDPEGVKNGDYKDFARTLERELAEERIERDKHLRDAGVCAREANRLAEERDEKERELAEAKAIIEKQRGYCDAERRKAEEGVSYAETCKSLLERLYRMGGADHRKTCPAWFTSSGECDCGWAQLEAAIKDALAPSPSQRAAPEGCTPADARVLRAGNHTIAQEKHEAIEALRDLRDQIERFAVENGEADFETGRASKILAAHDNPAACSEGEGRIPQGARCWSCDKPYNDFGLDVNVPRSQWLAINQGDESGLLCASCIVARGANLIPGATCAHLVFEVAPK